MTDETGEHPRAVEREQTSQLEKDVAKLRILEEENARTLRLIAEGHGGILDSHSAILDGHTATLDAHSAKLDSHSAKLDSHSAKLDSHSRKLDSLGRRLDKVFIALEPLQQIKDFIERVAHDHELRITALEKPANLRE